MDRGVIIHQLQRMPGVGPVRADGPSIKWFWNRWPGYNSIYVEWDGVVQSISLSVDFELTVEEIISRYGLPDATNAVPFGYSDDMYIAMNLFYPQHGFYCKARVLPYDRPVLEPRSVVYEVLYIIPADSIETWFGSNADKMHLQPWPGYGELAVASP